MRRSISQMLLSGVLVISTTIMISLSSCSKEGPAGANGANGTNGTNGVDANQTCKLCHTATVVDAISTQFQLSKHEYGAAAFEEAGSTSCGPCHTQEAFKYVCANNISSAFNYDAGTGKWTNGYASIPSATYGNLGCFTCHSSLHTTYGYSDVSSLTTTAPVSMTMYGGAKTINLTQDGGISNLCVKCHQPRPLTVNTGNGRVLNYDSLKAFPMVVFFDSAAGAVNMYVKPSYRMHVHYGPVGAVYAGIGGIEFSGNTGDLPYTNSPHTTLASCQDCHMAPMSGAAGGHSFKAKGNFNGCNVSGCHSVSPITATSAKWTAPRTAVKTLLDALATKINACGGGHDILHKDANTESNLWAGLTTGNYDGYLDIYSSSTNPSGYWRDPYGSGATNAAKPKFPKLLNVQMGAMINFQFCLREYSLGIHNTQYVTALMTNTLNALTAAGL
jgi:hypothetical protein